MCYWCWSNEMTWNGWGLESHLCSASVTYMQCDQDISSCSLLCPKSMWLTLKLLPCHYQWKNSPHSKMTDIIKVNWNLGHLWPSVLTYQISFFLFSSKISSPIAASSHSLHQGYKELYSRTLRALQPLTDKQSTSIPPTGSWDNEDIQLQRDTLHCNVSLILGVLEDVLGILKWIISLVLQNIIVHTEYGNTNTVNWQLPQAFEAHKTISHINDIWFSHCSHI